MNKNLFFLAVALAGSLVCSSCKSDDNEDSVPPEHSLLIGTYLGVTTGSSQHFEGLTMPNVTDTVFVTAAARNSSNFDILYVSSYWGEASFSNVSAEKADGKWVFADAEGVIRMPNRNPNRASEVVFNEYPATLTASSVTLQGTRVDDYTFTVNANLGERAGVYTMVLTPAQ